MGNGGYLRLTCSDELRGAIGSHASPPGWSDGDVVLSTTLQGAKGAAGVGSTAAVQPTIRVEGHGSVEYPRHAAVPGHRDHVGGAVHQRIKPGRGTRS